MAAKRPMTGRRMWRLMRADTKKAAARRTFADFAFAAAYPEGHMTSIRWIAEEYARNPNTHLRSRSERSALEDIHPDAFELFVTYGVDYTPTLFEVDAYNNKLQPRPGGCFRNASLLLTAFAGKEEFALKPVVYVEGVVDGLHTHGMLHAWNSRLGSTKAYDWTLYAASQWCRYLGIPFTKGEYDHILQEAYPGHTATSLFRRERFSQGERVIREVLQKREPAFKNPAE